VGRGIRIRDATEGTGVVLPQGDLPEATARCTVELPDGRSFTRGAQSYAEAQAAAIGQAEPTLGRHPSHRLKRDRFPYRQILRIVPLHLIEMIRLELSLLLARARHFGRADRFAKGQGLLVNVGCGATGKPGWVGIDGFPALGVSIVADVRHRIPLADGSAQIVFTEHLVEHLDYERGAPTFFRECLRILEPGGLLRVIVPDGERYLRAYVEGTWEAMNFSPLLASRPATRMEVVNGHFRQGIQHRFSYDAETLKKVIEEAGFQEPIQQAFGKSLDSRAAIDLPERASESLYVEAVKPKPPS